ncbi:MAG: ABC transporter substrate-binding protein, partial [Bacteroidota bacterium]
MKTGSYDLAFGAFAQVKSRTLKPLISNSKYHFLDNVDDLSQLKELYNAHPDEKELAEVLAQKIAGQTLMAQDRELLNNIIDKFSFDREEFNTLSPTETIFKDTYHVAVLLPFLSDQLEPDHKKQIVNQNVLDLYLGIRLAVDTLKAQGIDIELLAYDTKRDTTTTRRILEKEELKGIDLIIGPLFTNLLPMVNEFSFKNKINVINPVHSRSAILGGNPYSFLYRASDEVVGEKAAEYMLKAVVNKPGIIFYGDAAGDSTLAYAYKNRMEEDEFDIILTQKVSKDDTRAIQDALLVADSRLKEAATVDARGKYSIALDSISHIFVAADNNFISSPRVLTVLRTLE